MNLLALFRRSSTTAREVRAEIWRLGSRYQGAALEGALRELEDPDLSAEEAQLLRACVRKLRAQAA
jgi:hypothetical protein